MDPSVVGLIIGLILAIITVFLILAGSKKTEPVKAPVIPQKAAAAVPDDLVILEGIGPKIATILNQAGIKTFAQLAAAEQPALKQILKENGLQFTNPSSWPEQARLAAAGKMDELKALQEKLVAGR